jgi:hypothetical protein
MAIFHNQVVTVNRTTAGRSNDLKMEAKPRISSLQ